MKAKPSVILITIDSLRADHLSCLGYSEKTTPNIDKLTENGILFSQAFSNGAGSVESFPAIISSTYVQMNPNSNIENGTFWAMLSQKWFTLAEILKEKGYLTVAYVNEKVDLSSIFGYARGFQIFEEISEIKSQGLKQKMSKKINALKGNKFLRAEILNLKAIEWVKRYKNKPFFLWLHYMDTHSPPNPKHISLLKRLKLMYTIQRISGNESKMTWKELNQYVKFYDQEIKYLDEQISCLINKLAEENITADNTFFIILSDHGEQFAEHGEWGHGRLYDEVLHVPLFIMGPNIPNGEKFTESVSLIDVPPTIINLCGLRKVETFQGKSLLPFIYGKNYNKKEVIISETLLQDYSYRTDEWKYILHLRTKTHELYNLKEDSNEKINLASQHQEKTKEFKKILNIHIHREQQIKREQKRERAIFVRENQKFLEKYPKRGQNFITKILGVPYNKA